jgi:hypothetical protein
VIGEAELAGLLKAVDLEIDRQRLPAVLANLQRIEQVAAQVTAIELGPEDEIGPEWRP